MVVYGGETEVDKRMDLRSLLEIWFSVSYCGPAVDTPWLREMDKGLAIHPHGVCREGLDVLP